MSKNVTTNEAQKKAAVFGPLFAAVNQAEKAAKKTNAEARDLAKASREEIGREENRLVVETACWNAATQETLGPDGEPKNCARKKARSDFFSTMQSAGHVSKSQRDRLAGRVKQVINGTDHGASLLQLDKKGAPDVEATLAQLEAHKIVTKDDLRAHFAAPKPTGAVAADTDDAKAGSKSFANRSAKESQTPWELRAAATKAFQAGWDATCKELGVNVTALRKAAKKTSK